MAEVRVNDYKLMRARDGRMLAGVGAGLAQATGLDVTLVRLCIGAMVLSGWGIAAYILMWVIVPEESPRRGRVLEPAPESTARIIRIALVGLAALSLFDKIGGWGFANPRARGIGFDGALGLILLGIGVAVLFTRHRPDRALWETSPPPTERGSHDPAPVGDEDDDEPPRYAGPFGEVFGTVHDALSDAFGEVRTTISESRPHRTASASASAHRSDRYDDLDDDDLDDDDLDDDDSYEAGASSEPTRVAMATGEITHSGGAALIVASIIGWLVLISWVLSSIALTAAWAVHAVSIRSPVVLGVASWLVLVGVSRTLLHAKFARAIVPALALLLIPIGIASATVRIHGDVGDFVHHPTQVTSATLGYRQAAGRIRVDLARTHFAKPATTITARLTVGRMEVVVPNNVAVKVNTRLEVGAYEVFGSRSDAERRNRGLGARGSKTFAGCEGAPTLTLNLRTDVGYVQVHRANRSNEATCETVKKAA